MKKIILIAALIIFSGVQLLIAQITEKPEFGKFAIINATIHTVTNGVIENGVVLIENHTITEVGRNFVIPVDFEVIDATNKHIYPGFIDANTRLGLREIGSISVTLDYDELGDFNPHMKAFTAINPSSVSIPVTRVSGVTNVVTLPRSGVISGKAVILDLWGYTPDDMAMKRSAGLHIEWPTASKGGFWDSRSDEERQEEYEANLKELNDFWAQAEFYNIMMSHFENGVGNQIKPDKDNKMEAMREVMNGDVPVIISVDLENDIRNALLWANEKSSGLKFIFAGVSEGWRVADELAEADIPVITSSLYTTVRDYDNYQRPYQNAGLMEEAGVKVAISSEGSENTRNLSFNAGYAAAYGLGREASLKAVTINPAEIFGVSDQIGSIEKGKKANLFISDGDPFEPQTQIGQVFINGYKIPMVSRQTQLYEEFLNRDAVNR